MSQLLASIIAIIEDSLRLLALESQRAALSLSAMLGLAAVVALLVSTSWLMFMAAISLFLSRAGVAWEWTLVLVALLNLGLSALIIAKIQRLSRYLRFSNSRRHLRLKAAQNKVEHV